MPHPAVRVFLLDRVHFTRQAAIDIAKHWGYHHFSVIEGRRYWKVRTRNADKPAPSRLRAFKNFLFTVAK